MEDRGSGGSAGLLWLLQAFSGLLLILLLGVHLVANHYIASGGLRTYADVVAYISNPVIFIWEAVFLIVVATHAALGVRAVLLDLALSRGTVRVLNWVLSLLALVAIGYGLWLTLTIRG
jgi:Succinate dehydrogenase, hydrophobic anchor subunit